MRNEDMTIDRTHSVTLTSWVESANGHREFPIQNLPLGVFSVRNESRRVGIAIGDEILDLVAARNAFHGDARDAVELCGAGSLDALMAADPRIRRALRLEVSDALVSGSAAEPTLRPHLFKASACTMHLPARVGGFSDFFAGLHHAVTAGRMLRPNSPLSPNYKHVPIAYNSRASTIGVSPARIRRPSGQIIVDGSQSPIMAPTRRFDYEFEIGIWIGRANSDGEPIDIANAAESIFGFCILNDWSSRDIQRWEAQPLGPFLAKSTATTISPWIITPEALAPFRAPSSLRTADDPVPLPYLMSAQDQAKGALDVELEILLSTRRSREAGMHPERVSATNAQNLYWTPAQLVAHHTVNGCILHPGDIFGSGTISGSNGASAGCLLEHTLDGTRPLKLASGEERGYLEDYDEVSLRAHCRREGFASIGFGECRGEVLPAR
jgi:fumarylacetoacetase